MDHLTDILEPAQTNNKHALLILKQMNSACVYVSHFRNNIFLFLADRITVLMDWKLEKNCDCQKVSLYLKIVEKIFSAVKQGNPQLNEWLTREFTIWQVPTC